MTRTPDTSRLLAPFLDDSGKVKSWPAKRSRKLLLLAYLTEEFAPEVRHSEPEMNDRLNSLHTFADPALLRRELFDAGFFDRTLDCTAYWRRNELPNTKKR